MSSNVAELASVSGRGGDFAVADRHESKIFPDGSSLVRCQSVPWTTWALPGSYFKLLHIDRGTGFFTAMIKIDAGVDTGDHHHFGNAQAYVLEGEFQYEYGSIYQGDYICESGGINHAPVMGPKGATFLVVFHGGISGVGPDGLPDGIYYDGDWMYRTAKANGAADHLPPPPFQAIHAAK